ncbi:Hint domain-containing protein [Primorskyibacter sp. S87]|uniref:Hint domain-containing protein n=1 Tax=Primorskyibacter sp. S87 TaxID=3415126 RepID=UPI003C7A1568
MPFGYLVTLGTGNTLGAEDAIGATWTSFTTDQSLGSGEWAFTGTVGTTNYYNETETGEYYLALDGNVYFIPDLGPVTTVTSAETVSAPFFADDNVVLGTIAGDTIDGSYSDINGNSVDSGEGGGPDGNDDTVLGLTGDDSIESGLGDDLVVAGSGDDTVDGGDGNDVIWGDAVFLDELDDFYSETESLNWFAEGVDGTDLSAGFTQTTGGMDVSVSFNDDGNNSPEYRVETTDEIYRDGDAHSDHSALYLYGSGDGATSTTTINFAANANADLQDEVANVTFRINDIDWASGNHEDQVTVNAYDADGAAVTVTLTPSSSGPNADTVSGNTITAGQASESQSDADGSVLVEIAGPVAEIEIVYGNLLSGTQAIWVSDIYFQPLLPIGGDDSISGGDGDDNIRGQAGNDTVFGDAGDDTLRGNAGDDSIEGGTGADQVRGGGGADTIIAAQGDDIRGGGGDDYIRLADLAEAGTAGISITGNENGETDGDTLDFGGVADLSTLNLTVDQPDEKSGTVELYDGTLVTFDNIENIICFTPGTLIQTAGGSRPVEDLQPGDLIVTRDSGLQPLRWVGSRTVQAEGRFAPIRVGTSLLDGAEAPLLVSPQHRLLWSGSRAQLLFGDREVLVAARHLLDHPAVSQLEGGEVTYLHLMFDRHEIVYANGAATESFYPGGQALGALSDPGREEMFALFPELRSHEGGFGPTARLCLRSHESRVLAA